jgi:8-oxo-dGTP pyrophosphatase MutT (NUDIX family)
MVSLGSQSFILRLRQRLRQLQPRRIPPEGRPSAGVLLPFYDLDGETHLLFTRRTDLVEHHKGQICFPGGSQEATDPDLLFTSLRETFEEVGVRPEDVEPIGQLHDIVARGSNFVITPYVGVVHAPLPYPFAHAQHEVEEILEVPLASLLDEANVIREVQRMEGEETEAISYRFGDHVIWGATARILRQLLELIREKPA